MKRLTFILLILCVGTLPFSCSNKHDNSNNLVTKRIQYDVSIKNLDPDMDWWVQNIEGSNREKIISDIMLQVTTGKVKAYDFQSCKPYTIEEINNRMRRVDSISMERPTPPYQMFDTIVVTEVHQSEITKLRFLEEWSMDQKTLAFSKKVAGMCPLVERHTESGELRGYSPLFWVFFDEKYPGELQAK